MAKYYGKSQEIAQSVLERFKSGNVAEPLKMVLLSDNRTPMAKWSFLNQFVCILSGCTDARGIKQWAKVGRKVTGEKARTYILAPLTKTIRKTNAKTGEEETSSYVYGFKSIPVWDVEQTHGDPLPEEDEPEDHKRTLESLPLLNVAEEWGVKVLTQGVQGSGYLGYYSRGADVIVTGVENPIVFLHELVHKADYLNGTKVEEPNHPTSEAVAQLGACILAHMIGLGEQADEGFTWKYIQQQAGSDNDKAVKLCTQVLDRTCKVVNLILETAEAAKVAAA